MLGLRGLYGAFLRISRSKPATRSVRSDTSLASDSTISLSAFTSDTDTPERECPMPSESALSSLHPASSLCLSVVRGMF